MIKRVLYCMSIVLIPGSIGHMKFNHFKMIVICPLLFFIFPVFDSQYVALKNPWLINNVSMI